MNKHVKSDELDFKLFISGELEIISEEGLASAERKVRLQLLKNIIYYYSTNEFTGLKAFYAAWLREIELGKKTWEDDSQQIENAILSKYLLKGPKQNFVLLKVARQLANKLMKTEPGFDLHIREINVWKRQTI